MKEEQVQKLVQEAVKGNNESFGQIYDLYAPQLFNFVLSRVRNKQLAEDILQTVFMKAWNSLSKYQPNPNAKFSTWLFQIANFTVIDYWRTKKETVDIDKLENLVEFSSEPKLYENYDFLWKALDELPADYATILHLRFIQDLDVAECAQILGKTQVGVRVMQHRALKSLKKVLSKNGHENF
jgi:RNA polymerase sigma-70 factor (ECF subfamily)